MASGPEPKRLPSGKWRIQFERYGKRYSHTEETKAACYSWWSSMIEELDEQRRTGSVRRTLTEAMDEYARKVSPQKSSPERERWERKRLECFKKQFGPVARWDLDDITERELAVWRDKRLEDVKASSLLRDATLLRHVFTVARDEWKWMRVTHDPWKKLKLPEHDEPRTRLPTPSEIRKVCRALDYKAVGPIVTTKQQTAAAFLLACHNAMRGKELLLLEKRDIDLRAYVLKLRAETTKSKKARTVPIDNGSERLIRRLIASNLSGDWDSNPRAKLFRCGLVTRANCFIIAVQQAGIEDLHFHDSRAEACTRLARVFDVLQLSKITGHDDIDLLRRVYYREKVEQMVHLVRRTSGAAASSAPARPGDSASRQSRLAASVASFVTD